MSSWYLAICASGTISAMVIDRADCAAAWVRSRAAASLARRGKSSLPSNRMVTFAKSIGRNGSSGRSFGLA